MARASVIAKVLRRAILQMSSVGCVEDAVLLERYVITGDTAAFEEIVRRHGPMVWRVCRRQLGQVQDAEDAFQATFIVLAQQGGRIINQGSLASWLHGVAHRIALKARQRLARARQRTSEMIGEQPLFHSDTGIDNEVWQLLDDEIQQLPERLRLPIVLCYLEGRTNVQAAQQLSCSVRGLEDRLRQARQLLQQRLTRRGVTLPAASMAAMLGGEAKAALPAGVLLKASGLESVQALVASAGTRPVLGH